MWLFYVILCIHVPIFKICLGYPPNDFIDNELPLVYDVDPVFKLIDTTSQKCIIMTKVVGPVQ